MPLPFETLTDNSLRENPHDSSPTQRGLSLSIIIPTRNEAGNIEPLLEHIQRATQELELEVIFVDDSTDNTPQVIQRASERFPFEVTLIARPPECRNGLGMAVVEGMRVARSEWLCVMDGDLQHPPAVIPQLLDHALATGSNLVAASRLTAGGSTAGLSPRRKLISHVLALASRLFFPRRLRQVSDPLTGFFLVRRDALEPAELRPEGFKILLEVLVRSPKLRISEVPFEFGERHAGESKANSHEALLLFRQMFRLYVLSQGRLARFAFVGATGFGVNTLAMALFTELSGLHYLLAAVLATQTSTLWNFAGTEWWVFNDRRQQKEFKYRLLSYLVLNNLALLLRGPMLVALVAWFGMHYLWANMFTLLVMTVLRFGISDRLIWRGGHTAPSSPLDEAPLPAVSINPESL